LGGRAIVPVVRTISNRGNSAAVVASQATEIFATDGGSEGRSGFLRLRVRASRSTVSRRSDQG